MISKWVSQTWARSGVGTKKNLTRLGARQRRMLRGKPNKLRDLDTTSGVTLTASKVEAIEVAEVIEVPIIVGTAPITEAKETTEVTTVVTDVD